MEGGVNEFAYCPSCKRGIDLWHAPQFETASDGTVYCVHCVKTDDPSIPPWTSHMMHTVEPYIKWRCERAVEDYIKSFALMYLEKSDGIYS